ncbi:MAG: hypothetical protein M3Y80_01390, partial [Verrucomicrobiota bacterium]|nr:hypothetical protein [Verrucomicrobiota bacterium]
MKKLLIASLALSLTLLAAAAPLQAQATPTPVPTWAQSYGFGSYDGNGQPCNDNTYCSGSDLPVATAPMPDGGVVVAGRLAPNEVNPGSTAGISGLVRYDPAGVIVWQQALRQNNGPGAQNRLWQMRTDAAGNVFICGGLGRDDGNIVAPFVAKFSPEGTLLWRSSLNQIIEQDIINGVPTNVPYGVTEYTKMDLTSDGGVVVGSYVYSAGNGRYDPIIVKFNADGAVGLHRIFYADGYQYSGVLSVCERQGGNGFAVLLLGNGQSGEVVVLTDGNGNPVLQRSFNRDRTGGDANFITRSMDGGYFLLGAVSSGAEVRKLRADLTPMWQRIIGRSVGGNGLSVAPTLTATPDGGCILGGQLPENSYNSGGNGANSALLLTLDGTGILRSAHLLGGRLGEGIPGALSVAGAPLTSCLTTDGAVAFSIATFSYATGSSYKADWWVVKAGMDGKVAGFSDTMSDPPLDIFDQTVSSETAGTLVNDYGPGLPNEVGSTTTSEPHIIQEDLGNNIGINKPTIKNQTITPIPPPLHGGLSGITFAVNESTDPLPGLADTVLRFRGVQSGRAAGLSVRVQSSTNNGATWTDLADATAGRMIYAPRQSAYILNSTNYPTTSGVYFRATAKGPGYGERSSNPVGPFDLTSATPHLAGPLLFVTTNGEAYPIHFGVNQSSIPSGISVRVQTSQTPANEQSWTNAPIGSDPGLMMQDTVSTPTHVADPNQFYLGTDDYPAGEGNYFRAVATAPGQVQSLSIPYGPFTFVTDPASTVTISVNGANNPPNDIDGGYLLPLGTFHMAATAASGRFIKRLTLLYDGNTIGHFDDGATSGGLDYTTNIPGDHIIEAYATDDLGVTGAAAPIHVRILPAAPRKAFVMTASGAWNDPANWIDIQGNHGVPGANDFAIVSTFSPTISSPV